MPASIKTLEEQLNSLDPQERLHALDALLEQVDAGDIPLPEPGDTVNLHCHTAFSFNGYGYSPTYFAWKARRDGLRVAGVVDFDVLDAVDEFLVAARRLGLRAGAGIETRVFVPPFETREINSPGEPGVAYQMGTGFVSGAVSDQELLTELKDIAQKRNRMVLSRVNPHLAPVTLDYDDDVLPLTPGGNATERHLCMAFDAKAREVFPGDGARAAFWGEKLGQAPADISAVVNDAPALQGLIRAKTMKAGGPGYVKASAADFPPLHRFNAFILSAGAIPTFAWLDGLSQGEQAIEELLDANTAEGVAAVNIIPDRNWNIKDPDLRQKKVAKLNEFVQLAQARDLPIVVGTEMNAHGQRFVDDFDAPELQPLAPVFLEGAHILYAHTILQANAGIGYLSDWANAQFATARAKNAFFAQLGQTLDPTNAQAIAAITRDTTPKDLLANAQA